MKKMTQEQYIEKANIKHNFSYDYSKFEYVNRRTKSIIIHKSCGSEFIQMAGTHLRGAGGCPVCWRTINDDARKKSSKDEFIKESIKIHGDIFNFDNFIFDGVTTKGEILCKVCNNKFHQTPSKLTKLNAGCVRCSYVKRGLKRRLTTEDFIKKSKLLFGELYNYSKVEYKGDRTPVLLECKRHGYFYIKPNRHLLNMRGCMLCALTGSSKAQFELFEAVKLIYPDVEYNNRKILKGLELDISRSSTKKAIEFNGDYWHCNPKIYKSNYKNKSNGLTAEIIWAKDSNKNHLAKSVGFDILTIWESDWHADKYKIIQQCINFLGG